MDKSEQSGSPVDLNTADLQQLQRLDGVDEAQARRILEHRQRYGPFSRWEELEDVAGIGPALAERIRAGAVLGGTEGELEAVGAQVEEVEEVETELEWDEVEVDMDEVEVLTTLARLDLEAALAYEAGAEAATELQDIRRHLLRFQEEHLRHVADLNRLLRARGGTPLEPQQGGDGSLLQRLARLSIPFGPVGLVLTLLNNEQMTNATYELALEFEWDEEALEVLTRNAIDEQRHLFWLAQTEDELASDEEAPAPLF
jgi:competence ComEA-like helix-hairpin-helix protein